MPATQKNQSTHSKAYFSVYNLTKLLQFTWRIFAWKNILWSAFCDKKTEFSHKKNDIFYSEPTIDYQNTRTQKISAIKILRLFTFYQKQCICCDSISQCVAFACVFACDILRQENDIFKKFLLLWTPQQWLTLLYAVSEKTVFLV